MREEILRSEYIFINKFRVLGIIFEVIHVMLHRNIVCFADTQYGTTRVRYSFANKYANKQIMCEIINV